jgi:carboxylesterase
MEIMDHAHPITQGDGELGVLLCHGFTSSPWSMKGWADALAAAGFRVRAPRLPGHGTTWQELNRVGWQDWYDCVDREFLALRDECRQVFVGGMSLGGSLALRVAEQHPDEVAALALVNPAVMVAWTARLAPFLWRFVPALKSSVGSDIAMPGVDERTYDVTPLHAVAEMLKMWADVRARLDLVVAPTLLFRSAVDHVVPKASSETILRQISSDEIVERVLARSWHVATMDYEREDIFNGSIEFFRAYAGAGGK